MNGIRLTGVLNSYFLGVETRGDCYRLGVFCFGVNFLMLLECRILVEILPRLFLV